MNHDFLNRRKHERFSTAQALFIEVEGRSGGRESDNMVLRCEAVDISVGGLRIEVPEAIPAGARLNIAVPFGDWKDNLELAGKAMWCRPAEGCPGYWVGLQLEDACREDMERWCQVVYLMSRDRQASRSA
ncbi:PilZ domain-containing protein [Mangrovimicrobium sediminis]|uniref:PilZ domain-containing protein n=1 Tax=Mangrovimicrobium sediminis TaxID=2562682 RepID=A0A4Z0M5F5_9GAMM|nr:PilZ domain-containing protein [Haliea sp. SAOS-164]TGD74721.1 PilZ domain-containing protein [Haliea sp. SAOS-164]